MARVPAPTMRTNARQHVTSLTQRHGPAASRRTMPMQIWAVPTGLSAVLTGCSRLSTVQSFWRMTVWLMPVSYVIATSCSSAMQTTSRLCRFAVPTRWLIFRTPTVTVFLITSCAGAGQPGHVRGPVMMYPWAWRMQISMPCLSATCRATRQRSNTGEGSLA